MNYETLTYVLPNGQCLEKRLAYSLMAQIKQQVPRLMPQTEYTLRQICGEQYWLCLDVDRKEPNIAGTYAVQLAGHGLIPLQDTGRRNSANAHLYLVA